jgi:hypothetical protein
VVFGVVLVCAGSAIALIVRIAAIVARSCFVMGPRKIYVKAQGQPENHSGRNARSALLPFALSVIVTNECEYRNNLPLIHRHLIDVLKEIQVAGGGGKFVKF